jgi:hypothetical protein
MPKKLKQHLLSFLKVTGVYVAILSGLAVHRLLAGLVSNIEGDVKLEWVVTVMYLAISTWFCWRFYTGLYRDGDFWE